LEQFIADSDYISAIIPPDIFIGELNNIFGKDNVDNRNTAMHKQLERKKINFYCSANHVNTIIEQLKMIRKINETSNIYITDFDFTIYALFFMSAVTNEPEHLILVTDSGVLGKHKVWTIISSKDVAGYYYRNFGNKINESIKIEYDHNEDTIKRDIDNCLVPANWLQHHANVIHEQYVTEFRCLLEPFQGNSVNTETTTRKYYNAQYQWRNEYAKLTENTDELFAVEIPDPEDLSAWLPGDNIMNNGGLVKYLEGSKKRIKELENDHNRGLWQRVFYIGKTLEAYIGLDELKQYQEDEVEFKKDLRKFEKYCINLIKVIQDHKREDNDVGAIETRFIFDQPTNHYEIVDTVIFKSNNKKSDNDKSDSNYQVCWYEQRNRNEIHGILTCNKNCVEQHKKIFDKLWAIAANKSGEDVLEYIKNMFKDTQTSTDSQTSADSQTLADLQKLGGKSDILQEEIERTIKAINKQLNPQPTITLENKE
jgi:hypothetical protein